AASGGLKDAVIDDSLHFSLSPFLRPSNLDYIQKKYGYIQIDLPLGIVSYTSWKPGTLTSSAMELDRYLLQWVLIRSVHVQIRNNLPGQAECPLKAASPKGITFSHIGLTLHH
ncbi:hypothetical protein HID58_013457, partial [Brassica napus]